MIVAKSKIGLTEVEALYDTIDRIQLEVLGDHVHHGLWVTGQESVAQAQESMVRLVAELAHVVAGSRVCDIGCGYGGTARMLAKELGAQVTGYTICRAQHAAAASAAKSGCDFVLGDWLENRLPAASVDALVAIESSEHFVDKAAFFSEARRLLTSDGRLVVCTWLACEAPSRWQRRLLLHPICRDNRFPSLGSELDYRQLIEGAGLGVEEFQDRTADVERTWRSNVLVGIKALRSSRARRQLRNHSQDARFMLKNALRISLAYRLGALRYGVWVARNI